MKRYLVQVQYQTTASDHLPKSDVILQELDWLRAHLSGVCPEVMMVDEIPEPEKCPTCKGTKVVKGINYTKNAINEIDVFCPTCKGTGIKQDNTCPEFKTCQRLDCMFDVDVLDSQFQQGIREICQRCKEGVK